MASSPVFLSEVPLQDCSCHLAEVGYQFTNICNAGKAADENKNTTNTLAQVDAGASSLQTYSTLCQPQVPSARGSHSLTNAELLLPKQALSATPSGAGEMREPSPSSVRVAVLFGGSTRAAEFKDDLFLYEVASKQWFKPVIKGKVPPARSGHSAVYYKNKLYVFGGQSVTVNPSTGQPTFSFFNDVWVLTLKLGELRWFCFSLKTKPSPSSFLYDRAFPVISPPLTSSHTASLLGSIMYVFGGSNEEGPRNDLYACDLNNMQWYKCNQLSSHPTSKPSPREMHAASTLLCTNGSCAACAGSSAGSHDDQEAAAGDDSNKADAMCYAERFLYVMGGRGKKNVCSDFYQFDVLKQEWTPLGKCPGRCAHSAFMLTCPSPPSSTASASASTIGTYLSIFAGTDGEAFYNDLLYFAYPLPRLSPTPSAAVITQTPPTSPPPTATPASSSSSVSTDNVDASTKPKTAKQKKKEEKKKKKEERKHLLRCEVCMGPFGWTRVPGMHEEAELAKIRGEMTKTKIGRDSIGSNSPEVAAQASETEKKSGDRQRSSKKEKRQPTTHTHNTDDDDAGHSPEGRFVHALVDVSPSCTAGMGAAAGKELLLFGGISAEQDYQDSHVLSFQSLAV